MAETTKRASFSFYEISDIRNNAVEFDLRALSRTWNNPWDSILVENTCLHTIPSLADFALDQYHDSPTPQNFEEFEALLVEAAKESAEIEITARKDWFAENELELLLKIEFRNKAQKKYDQETTTENKTSLQEARKKPTKSRQKIQKNMDETICRQMQKKQLQLHAKSNMGHVCDMMKGFQGHFKNKAPKQFKDTTGTVGTDDYTNANIIQEYYQQVYSQQVSIDQNEINNLPQHQYNYEIGDPPSQQEVIQAIKRTASEKAPGETAVTTDMLKNLPPEAFIFLSQIIQKYWSDPECDFKPWHTSLLSIIYKGKGDTKDPKNW